jgi:hypothetical protein
LAVVIGLVIILFITESQLTIRQTVVQSGTRSETGFQNTSLQFSIDKPGQLSATWRTTPGTSGSNFTSWLFDASSCSGFGQVITPPDIQCAGTPEWTGHSNVSSDSLSFVVDTGPYTLVFGATDPSLAPDVTLASSLVLTPSPWWWV